MQAYQQKTEELLVSEEQSFIGSAPDLYFSNFVLSVRSKFDKILFFKRRTSNSDETNMPYSVII